jgi:hypothetical protein
MGAPIVDWATKFVILRKLPEACSELGAVIDTTGRCHPAFRV